MVKDGKVTTTRGYGYRNVEDKLPVTPRTRNVTQQDLFERLHYLDNVAGLGGSG